MRALKSIFVGLPREEMKIYVPLFARAKQELLEKEDFQRVVDRCKKNVMLKFISIPIAIAASYVTPIPPDFTAPIIAKGLVFFAAYRGLTIPHNFNTFMHIKELCIKYDLENKPELLNPPRKSRMERYEDLAAQKAKEAEEQNSAEMDTAAEDQNTAKMDTTISEEQNTDKIDTTKSEEQNKATIDITKPEEDSTKPKS